MTKKQKQALEFIKKYYRDFGYSPTYEEIMSALSLKSKSGVHRIVKSLEERGYIETAFAKKRSIKIFDDTYQIELEIAYDFIEKLELMTVFEAYKIERMAL